MSAPSIHVALIGYGFAGHTFHAPLIAATPGLRLSVVGSRDAGKVQADHPEVAVLADPFAAATDARADLVVIATPNDSHAPLARAALAAGKHVVVDKPFTLDLAQARGLAALAAQHGRLLSVFQNRRWDSDYLGIRQVIDDGLLGEVAHFESHIDRYRPQVRERWREQAGPGSGLWWDLGPHLVDQALHLFGLPQKWHGGSDGGGGFPAGVPADHDPASDVLTRPVVRQQQGGAPGREDHMFRQTQRADTRATLRRRPQ